MDIYAALTAVRASLRRASWNFGQAFRVGLAMLWAALARAGAAVGKRAADARWQLHDSSAERAERFRAWRNESRGPSPRREHLAYAWWQVRKSGVDLAEAARTFRAEHRRASTVAAVCLLLSLALAGTGAAFLTDRETASAETVSSTDYVVVTGPGGTQTYAVTVTTKGKKRTILRVVRKPGGGVRTIRDTVSVDGPLQILPGQTITTRGSTKTVTVTLPSVTVTKTNTETLWQTTTVVNEITVTETADH